MDFLKRVLLCSGTLCLLLVGVKTFAEVHGVYARMRARDVEPWVSLGLNVSNYGSDPFLPNNAGPKCEQVKGASVERESSGAFSGAFPPLLLFLVDLSTEHTWRRRAPVSHHTRSSQERVDFIVHLPRRAWRREAGVLQGAARDRELVQLHFTTFRSISNNHTFRCNNLHDTKKTPTHSF